MSVHHPFQLENGLGLRLKNVMVLPFQEVKPFFSNGAGWQAYLAEAKVFPKHLKT